MKEKSLRVGSGADYRRKLDEAIAYRDNGQLDESKRILLELVEQDPKDSATALVLAGVLFSMENFCEAHKLFREIVDSQPRSDLASRGLFHSLWKLGEYNMAFDEMKRFLLIADSDDYRQLLKDITNELKE